MQKNVEDKFASIIKGELNYSSSNLAVNLLLSRLIKKYQLNPQCISDCINEVEEFSKKYATFMDKEYEAVLAL